MVSECLIILLVDVLQVSLDVADLAQLQVVVDIAFLLIAGHRFLTVSLRLINCIIGGLVVIECSRFKIKFLFRDVESHYFFQFVWGLLAKRVELE